MMALIATLLACGGPPLPELGDVPAFSLTDQTGATVTKEQLLGKVWVADFMFTSCPDICPGLARHMAEIQTRYAGDDRVRLVSFTVDPATDTPPVLAKYGESFGADPARWHFLTGDVGAVRTVVVDGFKQAMERVPATDVAPETVIHGSRFVIVDTKGRIRAYPDPKEPGKKELYAAVDKLLDE